jgi:phage-related protein
VENPKALTTRDTIRSYLAARRAEGQDTGRAEFRINEGLDPMPKQAYPTKRFRGASVLEIVDDFDGDTYRAVYTVRFPGAVYVLHAFQKKSKGGIATPKAESNLIELRLKRAKEDYEQWSRSKRPKSA